MRMKQAVMHLRLLPNIWGLPLLPIRYFHFLEVTLIYGHYLWRHRSKALLRDHFIFV